MEDIAYRFYTKTAEAWEAMFIDLRGAKTMIDFERYIFNNDAIGQRFIEIFKQKAREGVAVRLLVDMVGSFSFYISSRVRELEEAGVSIKFFNPISPWRIANFTSNFFRDHRKLIVIDDAVGYIGGTGVDLHTALWRDTEVRFEGPIVLEMKRLFERLWLSTLRQKFMRFLKSPFYFRHFEIVTNSPRLRQRFIYRSMIAAIRNATQFVYLTTPYFIPDLRFLRVVRLAAKRGIDVRLLVPEKSDYAFADNSTRSYFTLALKAGVRVYLYQPSMLHAKTAIIDDDWASIGTSNLDNVSFRFNYEMNVNSTKPEFVSELKQHFLVDLTQCKEVTYSEWIQRPFIQKVKEFITWPFHDFF